MSADQVDALKNDDLKGRQSERLEEQEQFAGDSVYKGHTDLSSFKDSNNIASVKKARYVIPPGADINKELRRAVYERDLEKVKVLLAAGANANLPENDLDGGTILHGCGSAEIVKELLFHGANPNATNRSREPPLHTAITRGRGLEVIKELLKGGAWVDYQNRRGNTALNLTILNSCCDPKVVKLLLEHGADINIRNWVVRKHHIFGQDHDTPLENAFSRPECGKILIRYTLIQNFDDYRRVINLRPYREWQAYSDLSSYLEDCITEVVKMKSDEFRKGLSLYQLVTMSFKRRVFFSNQEAKKLAKADFSEHYPIYNEIIQKPFLDKLQLLDKLNYVQVYALLKEKDKVKKIFLNYDCKYHIAEYLYNGSLLNLIEAFHSSVCLFVEQESSTSKCVKRARLND